ncbi:class I SAM-dependent methyltransferase [Catenulispora yoronensis]|uniref:Class I SAM-dependent methyltransferase n=1 Tax=Catenulispora yoronensis TaxID=450799 RepID=A0ABN2TPS0_9ACTN
MLQDRHDDTIPGEPYSVTAEFYDILQAETDRRVAERRFGSAARAAQVGIVDVGAGTGIVTEVLLDRSAAPIHAVEPAAPMRVALLTRLAGMRADQRARVTVHPEAFQDAGLAGLADLVVCSNIAGVLEPSERRAMWSAAAAALTPGGVVLLEPPPQELPDKPTVEELPPVRLGPDTYSAQVCTAPDRGLLSVTYTYRVEHDGEIVREEAEEFTMWPASSDTVCDELRQAGLVVSGTSDGVIRATAAQDPQPRAGSALRG